MTHQRFIAVGRRALDRLRAITGSLAGAAPVSTKVVPILAGAALLGAASAASADGPEGASGIDIMNGDVVIMDMGGGVWTIQQFINNAFVDYSSFNLFPGQQVIFLQPGVSSRIMNRISGAAPTVIDGNIQANGIVYFVNPAGVTFGPGAVIDVAGLYAAAGNITRDQFLGGLAGGDPTLEMELTGTVRNRGTIGVAGGTPTKMVHLLGRRVINQGNIRLDEPGVVTLVGAGQVTIVETSSFIGQPTVSVSVGSSGGAFSNGTSVLNSGVIDAAGSQVVLGAGDRFALAINNGDTGEINVEGGSLEMTALGGGIFNSGAINAAGSTVDVDTPGTILHSGVLEAGDLAMSGNLIRIESDLSATNGTFTGDTSFGGTPITIDIEQQVVFEGDVSGEPGSMVTIQATDARFDGLVRDLGEFLLEVTDSIELLGGMADIDTVTILSQGQTDIQGNVSNIGMLVTDAGGETRLIDATMSGGTFEFGDAVVIDGAVMIDLTGSLTFGDTVSGAGGALAGGNVLDVQGQSFEAMGEISNLDGLNVDVDDTATFQDITQVDAFDLRSGGDLSTGQLSQLGTGTIQSTGGGVTIAGVDVVSALTALASTDLMIGDVSNVDQADLSAGQNVIVGLVTDSGVITVLVGGSATTGDVTNVTQLSVMAGDDVNLGNLTSVQSVLLTAGLNVDLGSVSLVTLLEAIAGGSITVNGGIDQTVGVDLAAGDDVTVNGDVTNVSLLELASGGTTTLQNVDGVTEARIIAAVDAILGNLSNATLVDIEAGNDVQTGQIANSGSILLDAVAGSVSVGNVSSVGNIEAAAGTDITTGNIDDVGTFGADAGNDANVGLLSSVGNATVNAGNDAVVGNVTQVSSLTVGAGQDATVGSMTDFGDATIVAGNDASIGAALTGGSLDVDAGNDANLVGSTGVDALSVAAGNDATVGDVTDSDTVLVDAGNDATVGDVTDSDTVLVDAGNDATVGDVTDAGDVTVTAGNDASVDAVGNVDTLDVDAGANASVGPISDSGIVTVDAGTDATVGALDTVDDVTVTAGNDASVDSADEVGSLAVDAGNDATVGSMTDVQTVLVSAGNDLEAGPMERVGDATLSALGDVLAEVMTDVDTVVINAGGDADIQGMNGVGMARANVAGTTRINGDLVDVGDFETDAAGTTELNANVSITDRLVFRDRVMLGTDVTVTGGDDSTILFRDTLDGGFDFLVVSGGDVGFRGNVGQTSPLASFATEVQGTLIFGGGLVRATGDILLNQGVDLVAVPAFATIGASGDIVFRSMTGDFRMGEHQKLTSLGDLKIFAETAELSDLNSFGDMRVQANSILILTRDAAMVQDATGAMVEDLGVDFVAGGEFFFSVIPVLVGDGLAQFGSFQGEGDALGTLQTFTMRALENPVTLADLVLDPGPSGTAESSLLRPQYFDLVADGPSTTNPAESENQTASLASEAGRVSQANAASLARGGELWNLLALRNLSAGELADIGRGQNFYRDAPNGTLIVSRPGLSPVLIDRLAAGQLEQVRQTVSQDLGDAGAVRASIGGAWSDYQAQAGATANAAGFAQYLAESSSESANEAARNLGTINRLLGELEGLNLTPAELSARQDAVLEYFSPEGTPLDAGSMETLSETAALSS